MTRRTTVVLVLCIFAAASSAVAPEPWWGAVRINEVCWGGNAEQPTAEWIELVNATGSPVDLEGWRLVSSDGSPDILLSGTIEPRRLGSPEPGYFLLERGRDDAVPGIPADFIYTGALNDGGESLFLYDARGHLIDSANAFHAEASERRWPAGTNVYGVPSNRSMERTDFRLDDETEPWATCPPDSTDAFPGTPKRENRTFNIPPSASLDVDPLSPQPGKPAVLDGSASADPNDLIVLYEWSYGDGEMETTANATTTHTYAEAGRYKITLTLHDEKGGVAIASRWVEVTASHPPIADFSVRSLSGRRTLLTLDPLRFQDESTDEEGELRAWEWDFGDGAAASEQHAEHTYARPGAYVISLAIEDLQGDHAVQTESIVIANRPPEALFAVSDAYPNEGDTVALNASRSSDADGIVAAYLWDFDGDGVADRESFEPVVSHRLERGGEIAIMLVVVDDRGDRSLPVTVLVPVNHLPVAQFAVSSFTVKELEPIHFSDCSYDPDGTITAWRWDFGDGTSSSAASPKYGFAKNGSFTVTLTVDDDRGARATTAAEVSVENLPPRAVCTVDAIEKDTGSAFAFDAASSSDPSPDGCIAGYEWDYEGDGTFDESSTAASVRHAYPANGTYTVRVRVVDDDGATATSDGLRVTVRNRPPTVRNVRCASARVTDAEDVTFSAQASDPDGTIVRWLWTFGDSATSSEASPIHRFPDNGTYAVSVIVVDDDGATSDAAPTTVDVINASPIAAFTDARCSECPLGMAFDASESRDPSPTGTIVHIAWDFGDGTTRPGSDGGWGTSDRLRPVHCYAAPGSYNVTLVVIDEEGAVGRLVRVVTVSE